MVHAHKRNPKPDSIQFYMNYVQVLLVNRKDPEQPRETKI